MEKFDVNDFRYAVAHGDDDATTLARMADAACDEIDRLSKFLATLEDQRDRMEYRLNSLADAYKALAGRRWIPVTERLPETGTIVLFFAPVAPDENDTPICMGWFECGVWIDMTRDTQRSTNPATHWQHLPDPPMR